MVTMSSPESDRPNVIVFGESGVGKSSVVNMLDGGDSIEVSDGAEGRTDTKTLFVKKIKGSYFNIYDTLGAINSQAATNILTKLIQRLDCGLHLLVYVVRGKPSPAFHDIYQNIFHKICRGKVAIVIVVTALENSDLESWWKENEGAFISRGAVFNGHACITSREGKHHQYQEAYDKSKEILEELIYASRLFQPWYLESMAVSSITVRENAMRQTSQTETPAGFASQKSDSKFRAFLRGFLAFFNPCHCGRGC